MSFARRFSQWLTRIRPGTRSLKTTLAVYFVPLSVVPALFISFYSTRIFEDGTRESLVRRASSEHDAIVAEVESLETEILEDARRRAADRRLIDVARLHNPGKLGEALVNLRPNSSVRLFNAEGNFLIARSADPLSSQVPYLPKDALRRVRTRGETLDRFLLKDGVGFVSIVRELLREKSKVYGILEEEYHYGPRDLADLKNRRQVDVVFLNRELNASAASFALSGELLQKFASLAYVTSNQTPLFVNLGDSRYAAFLYDVPAPGAKNRKWGYLAVFVSMTSADATLAQLKMTILYLTGFLALITTLLIFLFSNRLVKPIEVLVLAMKRVKTGRVEQIPAIDSTYEIEYLVHSFNEMTRNVAMTKQALELKVNELRDANGELRNAQGVLVQSAKMVSLGQLVAGVAHELNNPIGFIYSNMHHLSEYTNRIRELVKAYRAKREQMPEQVRAEWDALEKKLEIDFILQDMEDLTRSCVEGATRTKEIVLGLRTFSRMDESTFRIVDIHEGIRSTVKLLVSEMKDRISLHEEFGELPQIECNLSQMNQVFMNLLSNATQAIEGKGEIWIRTRKDGDAIVVEIEDSGSGIPQDTLEKIFDPFFTTKKVGQGTGLGLSIAYGLVQKHHGSIAVTSQLGQGTRFTLRLPIRQPAVAA